MTIQSRTKLAWGLMASVSIAAMSGGAAMAQAAAGGGEGAVEAVIVTGTRSTSQTQFTALSPVDAVTQAALHNTASPQLGDALADIIPSFEVKKLPTSDGLQFVRPAALNDLSPDMTLVLVDGKRFHRSAFLGSNGSQATDLAQIPSYAIGRVEVLRDGASAQYGSDAIAGVINIILDDKPGLNAYGQGSQFYAGDGAQTQFGVRYGAAIGDGGHLVATGQYSHSDLTSRTLQRADAIAFGVAHPGITVPNPVQRWGNPNLANTQFALDGAIPLSRYIEAYALGTYTQSSGINDINWRNPDANANIYNTTAVFPGFNLRNLYPAGFSPREGIRAHDEQVVGGVRHKTDDSFTWDLSASYGDNKSRFVLQNSINASLGPASPTSFQLGTLEQKEVNLNADAVYKWRVAGLPEPVAVAFGAEHRTETYSIGAGDPASYAVGPGANAGLAPASNGFPGYNPQQAGSLEQNSYGGYLDLGTNLTKAWSVDLAGRIEKYDAFGDTEDFKAATRYEFTPNLAVRGSWSTGFRAPTPGQLFSTSTSQGLDTVTLQLFTTGRLSPLNPVAQALGATPLKPETSHSLTGGFVWKTDIGFSGSVDAYQIDVADRFAVSPTITVTPTLRAQLVSQGVAGAGSFTSINFYTNSFDTRTRGVDLTGTYAIHLGEGRFALTAAYNHNETTVTRGSLLSNPTAQKTFEQGVPQDRFSLTGTYDVGRFTVTAKARYFGSWTDSTGNTTGDIFQTFGAVTFFDASLTYRVNQALSLKVGAEDLFNTYPDLAVFQASRGLKYSRNSPYDTNGGQYYVRLDARF